MGGGAGAETTTTTKKALGATASAGDAASVAPVMEQQQKQKPASLPAAAGVADDDGSAAAVRQSCGEEEQDDEQVERFYALLANIRALRGLYSARTGPAAAAAGRGSSRKRAREAEPPWTPAFRLEDFEAVEEEEVNQGGTGAAGAWCAVMNKGAGGGATAAMADDGHEKDGVAGAGRGGNKLGRRRRVAARG